MILDRTYSNLIIHVVTWICLSILLPLLPIGLGILIATLQLVEVSLLDLLSGIELLLISLALITTTGIDLSQARMQRSDRPLVFYMIRLALILLGGASIILLTLIYVDVQLSDVSFDTDRKFAFVGVMALSAVLSTVAVQLYIGYIRYVRSVEETVS